MGENLRTKRPDTACIFSVCTMPRKTRNQVAFTGSWVRIPPLPPKKHRNFDTKRIRIAVLSFCLKVLISRGFWLLSAPSAARQSDSLPLTQSAKALGSSRLSFVLWVSFNLRTIVSSLQVKRNSNGDLIGRKMFVHNRI